LPHLEQRPLYDRLAVLQESLANVIASADYQPYIRERIALFICPSDEPHDKAHAYRAFTGFVLGADVASTEARPPRQQLGPLPLSLPLGPSTLAFCRYGSRPVASSIVLAGPSSYVGSFGDSWTPANATFMMTDAEMQGDGLFGSNSFVRFRDIRDGLTNTFAVGERNWNNYGAVWSGVDFWDHCDMGGLSMTMGTGYYPMNSDPNTYPQSCDQQGAAGFSSYHPGGALFLFADGSARFIGQDIQSNNNGDIIGRGIYQRLANRHDGQPLGDF
jgi:prepilin-type processing-associated H-X9-DG protein